MKPLQSLLCLTIMAGVLNGVSLGVGVEGFQTNINAHSFPCRDMFDVSLNLDTELDVVPVCPPHNAYSFDLLEREDFNVLLGIAHEPESANAAAISEADMFAIRFQLPARLFVLDTAIIMLVG